MRSLLPALLLATLVSLLPAQEPNPLAAASVEDLLAQLSAPDFDRRRAASDELERRGAEVAEALREARARLPLEARLRVEQILAGLADVREEALGDLEGSLVSLSLKDRPLAEILDRLGAAGGAILRLSRSRGVGGPEEDRPPEDTTGLEVKDLPFFEALDLLCRREGLSWRRNPGDGMILLQTGVGPEAPCRYVGPFRFEISSFVSTRQVIFGSGSQSHASLQLQADVEDRAPVLGLMNPVTVREAIDDQGRSLAPSEPPQRSFMIHLSNQRRCGLSVSLLPPEADAARIAKLHLEVQAVVVVRHATGVLTGPFEPGSTEASKDALALRLDRTGSRGSNRIYTLSFNELDVEGQLPEGQKLTPQESLLAYDATGARMDARIVTRRRDADGRSVRELMLTEGTEPARIELRVPRAFETRSFTVECRDLPLQ